MGWISTEKKTSYSVLHWRWWGKVETSCTRSQRIFVGSLAWKQPNKMKKWIITWGGDESEAYTAATACFQNAPGCSRPGKLPLFLLEGIYIIRFVHLIDNASSAVKCIVSIAAKLLSRVVQEIQIWLDGVLLEHWVLILFNTSNNFKIAHFCRHRMMWVGNFVFLRLFFFFSGVCCLQL